MNELAIKLKQLREEKGITQKELSEILNISTSAYGYYEQLKSEPSIDIIIKLSEYYNVSTDYLLGKSNYKCCVETVLDKFNSIQQNDINYEKIKILFSEILLEINKKPLNISDKELDKLLETFIDYLEYKIYKLKK